MTTSYELLVVHSQDGIVRVEEIGMEDDLDFIGVVVEQLDSTDLIQNRIGGIVDHVMCGHRRQ